MAQILIVDGDERYRSRCSGDLEREGHEVTTASNGFDALRAVERHVPDVVITEIQLPGMDGLDLMSRLLAEHRQVIVILNSASLHYKESFMSWAADGFVAKSVEGLELRTTVEALLDRKAPAAVGA